MWTRYPISCSLGLAAMTTPAFAQSPSPNRVVTVHPPVCNQYRDRHLERWRARVTSFFVAGMQGVDRATSKLVEGDEARLRQAFLNIKLIAE
jgi:hypothetical protein